MRPHQFLLLMLLIFTLSFAAHAQDSAAPILLQIGRGAVQSIAWHPSGEYLLVSTPTGAWMYSPELEEIAHFEDAHLAALSPNGHYIGAFDDTYQFRLWDANTLDEVEYSEQMSTILNVTSLAWHPIEDRVYFSGRFQRDTVWGWSPEFGVFAPHVSSGGITWSPQGTRLAIQKPETGEIVVPSFLPNVLSFVTQGDQVRWQGEDKLIVLSVPNDGVGATLWDMTTNTRLTETYLYTSDIEVSHTGVLAALGSFGGMEIRNLQFEDRGLWIGLPESTALTSYKFAWSHDDRFVAAGLVRYFRTDPVGIYIIDVSTGTIIQQLDGLSGAVQDIVWNPDDQMLVAVDERQQIATFDMSTGARVALNTEHAMIGETMAWSNDSARIAVGDNLQSITVFDASSGEVTHQLVGYTSIVDGILWSPDDRQIGAWTKDRLNYFYPGNGQLWDVEEERFSPISEADPFSCFGWSPNGELLAVVSGQNIDLWNTNTKERESRVFMETIPISSGSNWGCSALRWSPSGHFITLFAHEYNSGYSDTSYTYNLETGEYHKNGFDFETGEITRWADGDRLVRLQREDFSLTDAFDNTPSVIEYDAETNTYSSGVLLRGLIGNIEDAYLSPTTRFAGAIDQTGSGMIWDTATQQPVMILAQAATIQWSPDETHFVLQRTDGSLWILEADGTILYSLPTSPDLQSAVGTLHWSPDSTRLAHIHDGVIDIWTLP